MIRRKLFPPENAVNRKIRRNRYTRKVARSFCARFWSRLGMAGALRNSAGYVVAVLASVSILVWVQRLWEADLHVPFRYVGDAVPTQVFIKAIIEHGWYLHNDAIGVPGGADMYDYPFFDNLHYGIIKLLSVASSDQALLFNLYYILTFPLTTLSSLLVCRRFGVSYALALTGSLLYAFLPYHFWRGEIHLLLAAYWLVPLMVLLLLQVSAGEPIFFCWDGKRERGALRLGNLRAFAKSKA